MSKGRSLSLNSLGLSVSKKAKNSFAKDFSDFQVYHSHNDKFEKAHKAQSISADLSDVALYDGFSCEFKAIELKSGDNYIWLKSKTNKSFIDSLTCESLSFTLDGVAVPGHKIN